MEKMSRRPWFYLELFEVTGIVTSESYWTGLFGVLVFLYLLKAPPSCVQGIISRFNKEPIITAISSENV